MPGLKVPISNITFTDGTLPKIINVDPIEYNGSLLLFEPEHPSGNIWASGVPAAGATLPNVLATLGLATTGSAVPTGTVQNYAPTANTMIVERTGKGGMHCVVSTTNTTANQGFALQYPVNVIAYIAANPTHLYYFSVWSRLTRAPAGANSFITQASYSDYEWELGSPPVVAANAVSTPANYSSNNVAGTGQALDGTIVLRNATFTGFSSSFQSSGVANIARMLAFCGGNLGIAQSSAAGAGKWGGWAWYRSYAEDLTVSGRTWAQVNAIDAAQLANAIAAPSSSWGTGRYNADTMTADTTLAA